MGNSGSKPKRTPSSATVASRHTKRRSVVSLIHKSSTEKQVPVRVLSPILDEPAPPPYQPIATNHSSSNNKQSQQQQEKPPLQQQHRKAASESIALSASASEALSGPLSTDLKRQTFDADFYPKESEPTFPISLTNDKSWPDFQINTGNSGTGSSFVRFDNPIKDAWTRGGAAMRGSESPASMFSQRPPVERVALPFRLFDLHARKVVSSNTLRSARYVAVSHVWGENLTSVDGSRYGVEWPIPVHSHGKVEQIIAAASVLTEVRYMWIDILCLDSRRKNGAEIPRMGSYFENAEGCIVWLDDPYRQAQWSRVLSAVIEINRLYVFDAFGDPMVSQRNYGQVRMDLPTEPQRCFRLLRKITAIEEAPWFKRVWTLQEGVIPAELIFVTPERYIVQRAQLLEFVATIAPIAQMLVDTGSLHGVAIVQSLQSSEIWKILKLRQLYQKQQISYQHVIQARKTRASRYEQDKLLGVLGLIHFPGMLVQDTSLTELNEDLYQRALDSGDFGALLFLSQLHSLRPTDDCAWLFAPRSSVPEPHQLIFKRDGINLVDVGRDNITDAHCFSGKGSLQYWAQTSDHPMSIDPMRAAQIARAWGMPEYTTLAPDGSIGPGYLATTTAIDLEPKQIYKQYFRSEFFEQYAELCPRAILSWLRCQWLQMKLDDAALAVIWTETSGPQIAVLTEPVHKFDGTFVTLMPGSYVNQPGPGCLICRRVGPLKYRKVGIGIGHSLKAASLTSLILV